MSESEKEPNQETFASQISYKPLQRTYTRLIRQPADESTVSTMARVVCDFVDQTCSNEDIRKIRADLETGQRKAHDGVHDPRWELPLATLAAYISRNLHNRAFMPARLDPESKQLRQEVLRAIDVKISKTEDISKTLNSPSPIVTVVLNQLVADKAIKFDEDSKRYVRLD
jgi:hypothetical protein